MKKTLFTAAIASGLLIAGAANAEGLMVEGNLAKAYDISGVELGVGYNFENERLRFTPIIGGFLYQGDNDRYYMDQMSNGARCRDSQTGRFAKKEFCDNGKVAWYGKAEVAVKFAQTWEVGAGYRASDIESSAYGLLAVKFSPHGRVQFSGGQDYYAVGVRFSY